MNHCYFLVNEHNMYIGNKSVNYPNSVKERYYLAYLEHILALYLLYTPELLCCMFTDHPSDEVI